MNNQFTPTLGNTRIQSLDVLRGLAIFGILMVNMPLMNTPMVTIVSGIKLWTDLPDQIANGFIKFLFEGKFYVLFSLLFGYGFWLFLNKSVSDGVSVIPLYRRRIFFLLLFGVAHVLLLWPGDILVFYALFGFLLILFRNTSDRKLVKWAIALISVPIVITGILVFFVYLAGMIPEAQAGMEASFAEQQAQMKEVINKALLVYASGSFSEIVQMRLTEYAMLLPAVLFFYPNVLAMFLLGQYAARKGYLRNPEQHLPFFRKSLRIGLIIGVPLSLLYAVIYLFADLTQPSFYMWLSTSAIGIGGPALTLAYVSAIVLMIQKGHLKRFSEKLAPVGRMALTNYLMHSVIAAILFLSHGFGLYGRVSVWQGILITIAIFAVQIPLSNGWLKRYKFGPLEWLWRSLTYGKAQPMKREKAG